MVINEVRIRYAGRDEIMDEVFVEIMKSLGYELWARGFPMDRERELCFLPQAEQKKEQDKTNDA